MSVFFYFEMALVAHEPSPNILCNDWKFPTFSACKKEHNASILFIRHGIETPHGKHTRHSFGGKVTTFFLIHQTFRALFGVKTPKRHKAVVDFVPNRMDEYNNESFQIYYKIFYIDNVYFGPGDFLKNIEMSVVGDNIFSIGCYGTIHEFIIIYIAFYKVKMNIHLLIGRGT